MPSIIISDIIPAKPEEVFKAWLDSSSHSKMTGSMATASDVVDANFTAGNGYIAGRNIRIEPYNLIEQSWRASDFPSNAADSTVLLLFEETVGGTLLTLRHNSIPNNGADYEQGWREFYFDKMKAYFLGL